MESNPNQSDEHQGTSELEARIEVTAMATRVLGTIELAEHWLTHPALALGGQKPIDLLSTAAGIETVKALLTRMEYGVYT